MPWELPLDLQGKADTSWGRILSEPDIQPEGIGIWVQNDSHVLQILNKEMLNIVGKKLSR